MRHKTKTYRHILRPLRLLFRRPRRKKQKEKTKITQHSNHNRHPNSDVLRYSLCKWPNLTSKFSGRRIKNHLGWKIKKLLKRTTFSNLQEFLN